ncbi:MAG: hypothetical protein U9N42_11220 [Campylobacterota bacterium]|nr:hypothetical protein [Campylobacterota bacterium]
MTIEQKWIEYDYNPFIIFGNDKKIVTINQEAQFLLGYVSKDILYDIAITYAAATFGFKHTFIDLEFGRYKFYSISVGYEDEDSVGIKFYQKPNVSFVSSTKSGEMVNIYTLIDLCISSNSINSNVEFIKDFDPSLPDVRVEISKFVKLLNRVYSSMLNAKTIKTRLFFKIGEHLKIGSKKYTLFSLEIYCDNIEFTLLHRCAHDSKDIGIVYEAHDNFITFLIPMIAE